MAHCQTRVIRQDSYDLVVTSLTALPTPNFTWSQLWACCSTHVASDAKLKVDEPANSIRVRNRTSFGYTRTIWITIYQNNTIWGTAEPHPGPWKFWTSPTAHGVCQVTSEHGCASVIAAWPSLGICSQSYQWWNQPNMTLPAVIHRDLASCS